MATSSSVSGVRRLHGQAQDEGDESPPRKRTPVSQKIARPLGRDFSHFRDGFICSLELTNFMTFKHVRIEPAAGLNLVLGPNGSGKSSLVCGIGLGLGGKPKVTGRETDISSYIRHGSKESSIKLELFYSKQSGNRVTLERHMTEGRNDSTWVMNGRQCKEKDVLAFVSSLNISVDDLTQYMPQDRVREFSAKSPEDLLRETEKVVLPPEVVQKHDELIQLRSQLSSDEAEVHSLETEITKQVAEVERLERDRDLWEARLRKEQERDLLDCRILELQWEEARSNHVSEQRGMEEREVEIRKVKEELKKLKGEKRDLVGKMKAPGEDPKDSCQQLRRRLKQLKRTAKTFDDSATQARVNLNNFENRSVLRRRRVMDLKKAIKGQEERIQKLTEKLRAVPNDIDTHDVEIAELRARIAEDRAALEPLTLELQEIRGRIARKERELHQVSAVEKQRLEKVIRKNRFVVEFWRSLEKKRGSFRGHLYFLPLELIPESDYAAVVLEANISQARQLSILVEDEEDRKLVLREWQTFSQNRNSMRLTVSEIGGYERDKSRPRPPLFPMCDRTLDDLFDAPTMVKNYLRHLLFTKEVMIGSEKTDIDALRADPSLAGRLDNATVFSHDTMYRIRTSTYSGKSMVTTQALKRSSDVFTSASAQKNSAEEAAQLLAQLKAKERNLAGEAENRKLECNNLEAILSSLVSKVRELQRSIKQLQEQQKSSIQKVADLRRSLRDMESEDSNGAAEEAQCLVQEYCTRMKHRTECLQQLCEVFEELVVAEQQVKARELLMHKLQVDIESVGFAILEKNKKYEELSELQDSSRARLEGFLEATIRLHDQGKRKISEVSKSLGLSRKTVMEEHIRILPRDIIECQAKRDALNMEIRRSLGSEDSKEKYEQAQIRLTELQERKANMGEQKSRRLEKIKRVQEIWESQLTSNLERLSNTFATFCSALDFNGELQLRREKDFKKWALEIMVRFRNNAPLQPLTAQRQSGGERSVATILFLLALQSQSNCPVRLVDEINQGMDPENETAVFLQMIKHSVPSEENQPPQTFLFSPKLLHKLVPNDCRHLTLHYVINGPGVSERDKFMRFLRHRMGIVSEEGK